MKNMVRLDRSTDPILGLLLIAAFTGFKGPVALQATELLEGLEARADGADEATLAAIEAEIESVRVALLAEVIS